MRRLLPPLLFACLLFSAGCQKLDFKQTLTIAKEEPEKGKPYAEVEFRAPKKEQPVGVAAECDVPVSVYLILMDDKEEAVRALLKGQKPKKTLAEEEKTKEASFEAKVPAGKGYAVLIVPAEKPGKALDVELEVKAR